MTAVWIPLLLSIIVIILLLSRINISIAYFKEDCSNQLIVTVSAFFRLLRLKYELNILDLFSVDGPFADIGEKPRSLSGEKATRLFLKRPWRKGIFDCIHRYRHVGNKVRASFNYASKRVYVKELTWHSVFGTGDAAVTGFLIGLMWNVKTLLYLIVKALFKSYVCPSFKIEPRYDRAVFNTGFNCILSIKTGHAIIAGIIFLISGKKDGVKGGRASYRGVNENYNG